MWSEIKWINVVGMRCAPDVIVKNIILAGRLETVPNPIACGEEYLTYYEYYYTNFSNN